MGFERDNFIDCTAFENSLSDYLEKALDPDVRKAMSAHALQCPLCHSLMNEVKSTIAACRQMTEPRTAVTRLEAKILSKTVPDATVGCSEFEEHLTDYLDGFLPATVFHRWERHAVLCDECTDLPGMVVRSLAAIVSYKLDELPVPAGLHQRILAQTSGSEGAKAKRPSINSKFRDWVRSLSFPISVPQLAPVALMSLVAFLVFSQTVSADGSWADVYNKSYQIAEQTYRQGAEVLNEATGKAPAAQEPSPGNANVEDSK